ncbi:MAG: ABC transporter permease [Spirochaetaceae bacterium]|nr:MAG: ABC transporter permease [Spirochaetaceae bacterium]
MITRNKVYNFALNQTTLLLFAALFVIFGSLAPRFLSPSSFQGILYASSTLGIMAVGITLVLLTGGIDLSLGSNMYLTGVFGHLLLNVVEVPVWIAIPGALMVGLAYGALNAVLVTRLKIVPFVATLGTLLMGRGLGLVITRSISIDFPDSLTGLRNVAFLGIRLPVMVMLAVMLLFHFVLTRTQFGRQMYAVGNNGEAAAKAGLRTTRIVAGAYVLCGLLASLAGVVAMTRLGRFNPNFAAGDELFAIAAAVLGGASLFGGIGVILPGTLLGALMIPMVRSGLVFVGVDIYRERMVMFAIVFLAVFIDSIRKEQMEKRERRTIMKVDVEGESR